MSIHSHIEAKLAQAFSPLLLQLENESHMHRVPQGSESHFKLILVSELFVGKRLIQRHRMVNEVLAEELASDIHALAMHTYTPQEWSERENKAPLTPKCVSG